MTCWWWWYVQRNYISFSLKYFPILPRWDLYKNATSYFEQIIEATPNVTTVVFPLISHLENHPRKTYKKCRTLLQKQGQIHEWRFSVELNTYTYQCRLTSKRLFGISTMWSQDVFYKTCRERWITGTGWRETFKDIRAVSVTGRWFKILIWVEKRPWTSFFISVFSST